MIYKRALFVPNGYLQSYKKAIKVSDICQLVNANLFTPLGSDTYNYAGITVTKNISAGTVTFNGTSTSNFWYHVHDAGSELKYTNLIKGYKYYISGMPVNDLGVVFQLTSLFNLQGEQIFTAPKTSDGTGAFNIYVPKGVTLTDFVVTPQLFNLTEMYGKGYEPATVDEFKNRWYKNLFDINKVTSVRKWINQSWVLSPDPYGLVDNGYYLTQTVWSNGMGFPDVGFSLSAGTYTYSANVDTSWDDITLRILDTLSDKNIYINNHQKIVDGKVTQAFTIDTDAEIYIGINANGNKDNPKVKVTITNIQLEKGSTATGYVPYTPNPAPYTPYSFIKAKAKSVKVSDICQLLDKATFPATQVIKGVTFTNNGDGTITANGTSTATKYSTYGITKIPPPPVGHKVIVFPLNDSTAQNHIYIYASDDNGVWRDDIGRSLGIITIPKVGRTFGRTYSTLGISLNAEVGWVMDNHIYKPQLFDLTEMYGAGNEPSTVEEFKSRWYKNLCDWNRLLELPVDRSHVNVGFYQVVVDVEPNTAYTLSRATSDVVTIPNSVCYLGMDNVDSGSHGGNCWLNHQGIPSYCRKSITLTSSSEGKLWIFFSKSVRDAYEAGENIFGYLQLEKGSTATSYVPYTPNPAPYRPYCFVNSYKKYLKIKENNNA